MDGDNRRATNRLTGEPDAGGTPVRVGGGTRFNSRGPYADVGQAWLAGLACWPCAWAIWGSRSQRQTRPEGAGVLTAVGMRLAMVGLLIGLGTAVPAQRYTQSECWEAVKRAPFFAALAPRSRALLQKVLCGNNGIVSRHLALESLEEAFDLRADTLHARFAQHAPECGGGISGG